MSSACAVCLTRNKTTLSIATSLACAQHAIAKATERQGKEWKQWRNNLGLHKAGQEKATSRPSLVDAWVKCWSMLVECWVMLVVCWSRLAKSVLCVGPWKSAVQAD
jgi:hypothetical protein